MSVREIEVAGTKLTIHELGHVCDSVTGRALTGSWIWESALVLTEWMASQSRLDFDFNGRAVLELGAGAGIPGMAAARLGASRVVLTDIGPLVPGLVKNVEANGLGERVEVRELVWGSDESLSHGTELGEFDLVLMSDVFFDWEEVGKLGKTLRRVCGSDTRVWVASEVRPWTSECLNELVSQGFEVVELSSQLGTSSAYSSCLVRDESLDMFVVFELVPPNEERHVADTCADELRQCPTFPFCIL